MEERIFRYGPIQKLLSQICSKAHTQFTTPTQLTTPKLPPTTTQELETLVETANRTTASIPRVEAIH